MLKSKHLGLAIAAWLLLAGASTGQQENQFKFAEKQPQSVYTIYNGQVYVHPEEPESWFTRLFSLDYAKNPVVSTVLGWSDAMTSWYGGSTPSNETETLPPEGLATAESINNAQYAPAPSSFGSNRAPPHSSKYQNNQQYGKQSYNGGRPRYPNNPQYPAQMQGRPQQAQYPPGSSFGLPANPQEITLPQLLNPSIGSSFPYPNAHVDIVQTLETQGSVDNLLGSQDRNFKAGYSSQHPKGLAESEKQAKKRTGEVSTPAPIALSDKAGETSKGDEDMLEESYPCPSFGQWKWNGDVCIAIGPYPTWACRPNDLVTTGRVTICRNKIFFPNEP